MEMSLRLASSSTFNPVLFFNPSKILNFPTQNQRTPKRAKPFCVRSSMRQRQTLYSNWDVSSFSVDSVAQSPSWFPSFEELDTTNMLLRQRIVFLGSQFPSPGEACKGRGGLGLEVVEGKIWVIYGFTGEEADDVYSFDIAKQEWKEVGTRGEKPSARSVFSTVVVGKEILIFGGEVDPSDLGHMGAGRFTGEAYGLDTETFEWKKWEDGVGTEEHPGARG